MYGASSNHLSPPSEEGVLRDVPYPIPSSTYQKNVFSSDFSTLVLMLDVGEVDHWGNGINNQVPARTLGSVRLTQLL